MSSKVGVIPQFILPIVLTFLFLLTQAAEASSNWVELTPATSPPNREYASMAFDPATGQMILFGGDNDATKYNDTWSWNGTTWVNVTPGTSLTARTNASMAFDPRTGEIVLFGGSIDVDQSGETWVWNGTTWTQVTPMTSPEPRFGAAMAYDPATQQMLLFGGYADSEGGIVLNNTWNWDGSNWTSLSPGTPRPAARLGASMAFDPSNGQMILFGGTSLTEVFNDTWSWNGSDWIQLFPATSPPGRQRGVLSFDSSTGQMILFGGSDNGSSFNDTWSWDGTTWKELFPADSPSTRDGTSMAYDSGTGQMILFGGNHESSNLNDTWNWGLTCPTTSSIWSELSPETFPPARDNAAMAYNGGAGQMILFGGTGQTTLLDDTWIWDGSDWSELLPTSSPSPRANSSLAFDPATGQTLLFGGYDAASPLAETWNWDGSDWTQLSPGTSPSARYGQSMAFNFGTGMMLLFGGFDGTSYLNDTWNWDGTTWSQEPSYDSDPSIRMDSSMAYNPATAELVLFGGKNSGGALNDTWVWSKVDGKWSQKSPPTSPPARSSASFFFDSTTAQMILFGGKDSSDNNLNDTWVWDGDTWTELSVLYPPSKRSATSMVFDEGNGQLILFGGTSEGAVLQETWNWGIVAPSAYGTPCSQEIYSGRTTSISLSSDIPDATFSWSVSAPGISGATAGSGSTIAQRLTTTEGSAQTATYTITPAALDTCTGEPITVVVTVKPLPQPQVQVESEAIFSGENVFIAISSSVEGVEFSWVATSHQASGASDGSGSSINQILRTTTGSRGTVSYQITPTYGGFQGPSTTVTIRVMPRPIVIATPSCDKICSGDEVLILLNSNTSGVSYRWEAESCGVDGASSGVGGIILQKLKTDKNQSGSVAYKITPITEDGYEGEVAVVSITVFPKKEKKSPCKKHKKRKHRFIRLLSKFIMATPNCVSPQSD